MRRAVLPILCFIVASPLIQMTPSAQTQTPAPKPPDTVYLLKPAHVFDGESAQLHDNWVVLVRGEKIEAIGSAAEVKAPADAKVIVVHKGLSEMVRKNHSSAVVLVFSHFMNDPIFDQIISALKEDKDISSN